MIKAVRIFILPILIFALFGCNASEVTEKAKTEITFSFWEPGTAHEMEDALQKIAEDYEALHPDVKVTLISEPVETYQYMINSRVVADELPDIQSNHIDSIIAQYNAGLIVNIMDRLNSESAYDNGIVWKDSFRDKYVEYEKKGRYIPFFGVETGIYYNKDVYRQLGLEVPQTWEDFINNCEVIEQSGKLPIAFMMQKVDALKWLKWEIAGGLFAKKHTANENLNINKDVNISTYELFRAVLNGSVDFEKDVEYQQEYREYVKRMEEFLRYCGSYPGFEETMAKTIFLSGEAAHIQTGSWDAYGMLKNDNVDFEVGVFKFPLFTEKETPYHGVRISTMTSQAIAVTKSVYKEEGKIDKVIDFMQYLTSKDVYQKFIDNTAHIPVIKGVECVEGTELFDFEFGECYYDLSLLKDESDSIIHSILAGNTPVLDKEFFKRMQNNIMARAKEYAESNNLSAENDYYREEIPKGVKKYEN